MLTYATVCSGIECMSVACRGLPLKPVFFSEIEPFPCAVLRAHYPDVPNLGDMSRISVTNQTEITNGTRTITLERPLDILAGGTPCQDVSVAGKRKGFDPEGRQTRSSLAFDFVRLARELGPRYVLWENVAGSIDSKNGPDFLRFVSALGDCGYSLAWRVFDAQYVTCEDIYGPDGRVDVPLSRAVPQRRRRVWVLGVRSLGRSGANATRAAEILFEPDRSYGDSAPRRETRKSIACTPEGRDRLDAGLVGRPPGAGGIGKTGEQFSEILAYENDHLNECKVVRSLNGNHDDRVTDTGTSIVHVQRLDYAGFHESGQGFFSDGFGTTRVGGGNGFGVGNLIVCLGKEAYNSGEKATGSMNISTDNVAQSVRADMHPSAIAIDNDSLKMGDVARTITGDHNDRVTDTGTSVLVSVGFKPGQSGREDTGSLGAQPEQSPTLPREPGGMGIGVAIASVEPQVCKTLSAEGFDGMPDVTRQNGQPVVALGFDSYNQTISPEVMHTLHHHDGLDNQPKAILRYIVRRLTPMECERLMGLPDKYTIPSGLEVTDELVAEFRKIFDTFGTIMAEYEHKVPPKPKSAKVVWKWLEKISNPDTCPDSPRYKACGNGWATNQPRWILTRLLELDERNNREQKD